MEKEFIPHEQALALKELGFDKPCMRGWSDAKQIWYHPDSDIILDNPTFSQAFRFFRDKYVLELLIAKDDIGQYYFTVKKSEVLFDENNYCFKTYEEAELECLKKLIEIVKKK